jgi:hypothetical protein
MFQSFQFFLTLWRDIVQVDSGGARGKHRGGRDKAWIFFYGYYTHMLINVRDKRKEIHNFTLYLYSKSIENEKIINIRFFNFVKLDPPVTKHSFEKS